MTRRVRLGLVTLLITGLTLTGCGKDDKPGEPLSTSPSPVAEAENREDDQKAAPAGREGACIVGSWQLDNDSFAKLVASAGEGFVIESVKGIARFTADAKNETLVEYLDWTITGRATDTDGTVTMVRNGQDSGTWDAEDGGTFTIAELINESKLIATARIQGRTMTIPTVEGNRVSLHNGVMRCEGDRLTLAVDGGTSVLVREP